MYRSILGLRLRHGAFLLWLFLKTSIAAEPGALPVGVWYAFPSSELGLSNEYPSPIPAGTSGPAAVMSAWSGGVYDSDRDMLVVWGGGHSNYSGNEVYAFGPLTSGSAQWRRLTNPSSPVSTNEAYYPDGRPVSRHTYAALDYMPFPYGKMVSCAIGSRYNDGYGMRGMDFYDFGVDGLSGEPWSRGPVPPNTGSWVGAFCAYNPVTKRLWVHSLGSGGRLMQYNPDTQGWTQHVQTDLSLYDVAAIDTARNILVVLHDGAYGESAGIRVWDLNHPDAASFVPPSSAYPMSGKAPGFQYDPVNDRFIAWDGGTALYALSIPSDPRNGTWQWSVVAADTANTVDPGPAAANGTYGRFRYVPSLHAVVVVSAADRPVYLRKLERPSSIPLVPVVTLSAIPSSIVSGQNSVLSWSATNAAVCTASGAWSGVKATSGTENVGPRASSTYLLSCSGSGGVGSSSITIEVQPSGDPVLDVGGGGSPVQSSTASGIATSAIGSAPNGGSGGGGSLGVVDLFLLIWLTSICRYFYSPGQCILRHLVSPVPRR
jgi:hypothetical protein